MPTEDRTLAVDFAARRPDALARAYQNCAVLLVSVARHVLSDAAAAEDCVHDALLRVWQTPGSYRPERGSLRAFLVSCVRNEALTRLLSSGRRTERERRAYLLEPSPTETTETADPIDAARARAALARLPEEQRIAIEYAYFENLSQTAIAERLGIPLGTVKGRTALAMRKLRAALKEPPA
jgi:RNA polymerase sigma-70 factor (ECF subfamily)